MIYVLYPTDPIPQPILIRVAMYTTTQVNSVKVLKSAPSFRKGDSHSVYMPTEMALWHGMAANMKPHLRFIEWNQEVSLETKMLYKSLKFIWADKCLLFVQPANVNGNFCSVVILCSITICYNMLIHVTDGRKSKHHDRFLLNSYNSLVLVWLWLVNSNFESVFIGIFGTII